MNAGGAKQSMKGQWRHSRNGGNLEEVISFMCCNRNNNADDMSKGLQIEEPDICIPWTLCESGLHNDRED